MAPWRNPQALYILINFEKFKNSIKIHFFIREIAENFEEAVKVHKSSFWHDDAHAFTSYPKL